MTDQIWHARKDFFDRCQNACAHVVNRRQGISETALDLLEKGDELLSFLGRDFDIAQHDLR